MPEKPDATPQPAEPVKTGAATARARKRRGMSDEDDIEASKAPLIEHLIELRSRLMRAMLAIFVAFLVCFYFASDIFNILVIPYERAAGPLARSS